MRDISEAEFDDFLAEVEGLVLVDFWAEWCRPCHVQSPELESLEASFPEVTFIKVNTDENQELARVFAIRALPTVVLLEPRRPGPGADVVYSSVGVKPRSHFERALTQALTPKVGLLTRIKRALGRGRAEPDTSARAAQDDAPRDDADPDEA